MLCIAIEVVNIGNRALGLVASKPYRHAQCRLAVKAEQHRQIVGRCIQQTGRIARGSEVDCLPGCGMIELQPHRLRGQVDGLLIFGFNASVAHQSEPVRRIALDGGRSVQLPIRRWIFIYRSLHKAEARNIQRGLSFTHDRNVGILRRHIVEGRIHRSGNALAIFRRRGIHYTIDIEIPVISYLGETDGVFLIPSKVRNTNHAAFAAGQKNRGAQFVAITAQNQRKLIRRRRLDSGWCIIHCIEAYSLPFTSLVSKPHAHRLRRQINRHPIRSFGPCAAGNSVAVGRIAGNGCIVNIPATDNRMLCLGKLQGSKADGIAAQKGYHGCRAGSFS